MLFIARAGFPQVRVWEDQLVIPTWEIGPPEKMPAFPETFANHWENRKIYPYPYKDVLTEKKTDKSYTACWLENSFIKLLVTPEIGGKIYGARDKTNNYDFFYWQSTVKPALISLTGAWVSGGIEWNFPNGHRPSTFSTVSHCLTENPDGSKTIWVGETELVYGMRWIVGITVYPGKSIIEANIRLLNPTPVQHSYYMWATTATYTNDNYQLIYPTRLMTGHGKHNFFHWPIYKGRDLSWWRNTLNPSSYFAMEPGNFFGGYDHGSQTGTVIVGNEHIMVGKKFWTWGTSPAGQLWDWLLSDENKPYVEPQAGIYSDNQPDFHWLQPGEIKSFKLYFFPVRDIGPFKNANIHGALNLEFKDDLVKMGVYSTAILENAIVRLTQNGNTVFEKGLLIDPSKPFVHEIHLKNAAKDIQSFSLSLLDENNNTLLTYTPVILKELPLPEPEQEPYEPQDIKSNDELWHAADKLYKFRSPGHALEFFRELVKRDSLDSRANISLAELAIKSADYQSALKHLAVAKKRDADNGKLFYLTGVAREALGDYDSAYDAFYRAVHFSEYLAQAYEQIARLDLRKGDFAQAGEHAQKAIEYNTLNPQLWALKATALRLENELAEAEKCSRQALKLDPLHAWAVNELRLALKAQGKQDHDFSEKLVKILIDDYHNYIHLASSCHGVHAIGAL